MKMKMIFLLFLTNNFRLKNFLINKNIKSATGAPVHILQPQGPYPQKLPETLSTPWIFNFFVSMV